MANQDTGFDAPREPGDFPRGLRGRPLPPRRSLTQIIVVGVLALLVIYGAYFWLIRRVVVGSNEVLVLLKKDGGRSLPGDQVVIPRAPDAQKDPQAYEQWRKTYGDCN